MAISGDLEEIIEGWIEKFDGKREVYFDEETRVFLLQKKDAQTASYKVVKELLEGHWFYFSEYYNSFKLQVATLDTAFKRAAAVVTHIAFGVPGDIRVFEIPTDNRVVIEPNGKKPYYQFFCQETKPVERYTPV